MHSKWTALLLVRLVDKILCNLHLVLVDRMEGGYHLGQEADRQEGVHHLVAG